MEKLIISSAVIIWLVILIVYVFRRMYAKSQLKAYEMGEFVICANVESIENNRLSVNCENVDIQVEVAKDIEKHLDLEKAIVIVSGLFHNQFFEDCVITPNILYFPHSKRLLYDSNNPRSLEVNYLESYVTNTEQPQKATITVTGNVEKNENEILYLNVGRTQILVQTGHVHDNQLNVIDNQNYLIQVTATGVLTKQFFDEKLLVANRICVHHIIH